MFLRWWVRWRRVAQVVGDARPVFDGRVWAALRRLEARDGIKRPIPLVASGASLPPGVFGVWRPVLVWPRHLAGRLGPGQVDAILAHELSHVRRRDNLAAAIHQVVEAVFWFHPLAWWLGRRLVAEREQACDEAVLRWGGEPGAYAESILTTCRFAVESAPVGMVGVAGADLKRRMEQIMMNDKTRALTVWRKLLLTVMASTSVAGPIAVGVVGASPLVAQTGPPTVERLDDAVTLTGSAVRLDPAPAKGMAAVSQARPAFQGGAEALPGVSSQRSLVIDQAADDHVRFAGSVQLVGGADAEAWEFLADEVELFPGDSRLVAMNVVFKTEGGRINAERVEFNTEERTGVFHNATGTVVLRDDLERGEFCGVQNPELAFFGEVVEKLGPRTYRLTRGGLTCAEGNSDWGVEASLMTVDLDELVVLLRDE